MPTPQDFLDALKKLTDNAGIQTAGTGVLMDSAPSAMPQPNVDRNPERRGSLEAYQPKPASVAGYTSVPRAQPSPDDKSRALSSYGDNAPGGGGADSHVPGAATATSNTAYDMAKSLRSQGLALLTKEEDEHSFGDFFMNGHLNSKAAKEERNRQKAQLLLQEADRMERGEVDRSDRTAQGLERLAQGRNFDAQSRLHSTQEQLARVPQRSGVTYDLAVPDEGPHKGHTHRYEDQRGLDGISQVDLGEAPAPLAHLAPQKGPEDLDAIRAEAEMRRSAAREHDAGARLRDIQAGALKNKPNVSPKDPNYRSYQDEDKAVNAVLNDITIDDDDARQAKIDMIHSTYERLRQSRPGGSKPAVDDGPLRPAASHAAPASGVSKNGHAYKKVG